MTDEPERRRRRIVDLAQHYVREAVRAGDIVVDATAGNGHDTVFLAKLVNSTGRVLALDRQPEAIRATTKRINDEGLADRVTVEQRCHSEPLPAEIRQIAAAMFNLGYLPGGDHTDCTGEQTTVAAVQQLVQRLRPGGVITVVAYRGHNGGQAETEAVERWTNSLSVTEYRTDRIESDKTNPLAPVLFVIHLTATRPSTGKSGT